MLYKLILISIISFVCSISVAQKEKIGLCLSGGGARGLAHIGVLRLLDEVELTPDYITGVSTGSLVAGYYAMGYSADSIEKIVKSLDWDLLMSDRISEKKVLLEEKKDFRNKLINLEYDDGKIHYTDGLIEGQQFISTLDYYTWPAIEITDFDSLPIPYRAVAADIVTCKKVILDKGSLAEAMRSSMSIPTVFSPVFKDSLLLVDGGLVRNFPISETREMGSDLVIGVYTGRKLYSQKELNTIKTIFGQVASFAGLFDAEEQKRYADYLIEPNIEEFPIFDFTNMDSIIDAGYKAALPFKAELLRIAQERKKAAKQKDIDYLITKSKEVAIDAIETRGNTTISAEQIIEILSIKSNDTLSQEAINSKIKKLYSTQLFDKISYTIENHKNYCNTLIIKCVEKPNNLFNVSLNYNNFIGAGLNVSFIKRNFLLNKSKLTLRAQFSKFYRLRASYFYYLFKNQKLFLRLNSKLTRDNLPAFVFEQNSQSYIQKSLVSDLSLNLKLGINSTLSLGAEHEILSLTPEIKINSSFLKSRIINLNSFIKLNTNTLDDYYLPRSGSEFIAELKQLNLVSTKTFYKDSTVSDLNKLWKDSKNNSFRFALKSRFFVPFGKKFSTSLRLNSILTLRQYDSLNVNNDFALIGGAETLNNRTLPFYGFRANEFISQNAVGAGIGIHFNINSKLQISAFGDSYIIEPISDQLNTINFHSGIALGVGYKSKIGPIKLTVANGNYEFENNFNSLKVYLDIGFQF